MDHRNLVSAETTNIDKEGVESIPCPECGGVREYEECYRDIDNIYLAEYYAVIPSGATMLPSQYAWNVVTRGLRFELLLT